MKDTFHIRELDLCEKDRLRVSNLLRGRLGTEVGHISITVKDKNGRKVLVQVMTYDAVHSIKILETESPNKIDDKPHRKLQSFYLKVANKIRDFYQKFCEYLTEFNNTLRII